MIKDLEFTRWLGPAFERVGNADITHKHGQITRPLFTMATCEVVEDSEPERQERKRRRRQEEHTRTGNASVSREQDIHVKHSMLCTLLFSSHIF